MQTVSAHDDRVNFFAEAFSPFTGVTRYVPIVSNQSQIFTQERNRRNILEIRDRQTYYQVDKDLQHYRKEERPGSPPMTNPAGNASR